VKYDEEGKNDHQYLSENEKMDDYLDKEDEKLRKEGELIDSILNLKGQTN
jgi:hypothetical protein